MTGGMTADDFIAEFRTVAAHSGIKDDTAMIEYFMEGLPTSLREKISMMDNPPTTLQGWQDYASKFDNSYRRAKAITARIRGGKPNNDPKKKWQPSRNSPQRYTARDPNAMEVDRVDVEEIEINRLSPRERDDHMKKGQCFRCHKTGHVARDHYGPDAARLNAGTSSNVNSNSNTWKRTGKGTAQRIRSLLAELDEKEKEEALDDLAEKDF
jgi:hypothetical protein